MKDMTQGRVASHVLQLAAFIALTTTFQTLYFLADLYFVGRLGREAVAGVSLAGNLAFVVLALTQALGVGATALVSQALGRRDRERAELLFNQAFVLSSLTGLAFLVVAFAGRTAYSVWLAADAATAASGIAYLTLFIPALALQFTLVALGSALRGMGDMKLPTLIQVGTVLVNIALAPVLTLGWGTGRPLGVKGAALASLVAIALGCVALGAYFQRKASPLRFRPALWRPRLPVWGEMLRIGLPAGGEFALLAVYMVLVYDITRHFGSPAQAGFGIGVRVLQALFLPAVAVAFATAPVVGQNYGAQHGERVREAFRAGALMSSGLMLVCTALCQLAPLALVGAFSGDPAVAGFGGEYLRIISFNFVASALVLVSSSTFQGIGNTLPPLASSSTRLLLFALPAYALSRKPGFELRQLWYLSVAAVALQALANLWLLQREFGRRLRFGPGRVSAAPSP